MRWSLAEGECHAVEADREQQPTLIQSISISKLLSRESSLADTALLPLGVFNGRFLHRKW